MKNKPLSRFYRATKFAIIGFATEYAFSITLELQSSEMTTICAIRAIYYGKQSSLLAGCNLDPIKMSNAVDLTLLQINPTHTILRYSSTQTSVGLALSGGFDIENVESLVLATRLVVIRVEEDQCTNAIFKILLLDDFLHLKECLLCIVI